MDGGAENVLGDHQSRLIDVDGADAIFPHPGMGQGL
jgi:hypothetical protein